ncbi:hypothetical protein GCM10010429_47790 [Micromonospora olivasterospora]
MKSKLEPQIAASATKPGSQLRSAGLSGVRCAFTPDTLPEGYDGVSRFPATAPSVTEAVHVDFDLLP